MTSEAVFEAMFHASADVILLVDEEGRIARVNEACATTLGHEVETLAGQPVEVLVPLRYAHHAALRAGYVENPHARAMGGGLLLHAVHAEGHEIPVDIALTPLVVDNRKFTVCVMRDMRGRIHTPEILRVQATALHSAGNGIVITDRRGVITWVNPAACAITGYSSDELVGQSTRILKSGEHDAGFYRNLWATINSGGSWSGTIVNRRKDGTLYHEEQTIAPVMDEEGQVSHFIAIKQDITDRHRSEEALQAAHEQLAAWYEEIESLNQQLRDKAIRDPLTGLHNRRFFDEVVERDLARAARLGEPVAIAMVDLDLFKHVNDQYGHDVGDLVLQKAAQTLRDNTRSTDLVFRFGGEEFVCVLYGSDLPAAEKLAELWRRRIEALAVDCGLGVPVRCTASIGLTSYEGSGDTVIAALRRADAALYEAKRSGRNRVVCDHHDARLRSLPHPATRE